MSFTRLRRNLNSTRGRPLKLVMYNPGDKSVFMKNLTKLKTADDKIRKISITNNLRENKRHGWCEKETRQRKKIGQAIGGMNYSIQTQQLQQWPYQRKFK